MRPISDAAADIFNGHDLPPFRNRPERRIDERDFFVSGEAEVDEPLAVERAGHLFQNLDAPLVVFDQIVVGRQDARDPALDRKRRRKSHMSLSSSRLT